MKLKSYQEFVNESKLTDWFKNKYEQFKNKLKSLKGEAYIKLLCSLIPKDILNLIKSEAAKLTGQKESLIINELFSSPFYTDEEVSKLSDEEYNQYLSKIAKDVENNPYLLPTTNIGGDEVNTNEISEFLREKGFDIPTKVNINTKPSMNNIKLKIDSMKLNPVAKNLLKASAYTFLFFMIFVKSGGGVAVAGETNHKYDDKYDDKGKGHDIYKLKINGEKITIDKKIEFKDGSSLSNEELKEIFKNGELDGASLGISGSKFTNFLNAEKGPKGTSIEGKEFKIIVTKAHSNLSNISDLQALEQSKLISKDTPDKVTKVVTVKSTKGYVSYSFTKIPKD